MLDISLTGAGLELSDASAGELEGRRIDFSDRTGDVRHVRAGDGSVRVGIEFVGLGDEAAATVRLLTSLGARW